MPFFHTIWRPLGSFLCILYWGPPITFFAYYMGPLRSVSSHTIWWPISDQFHCLLYGPPPQISFFACYRWATSDFSLFTKYMGPPLRSVSPLTIWGPLRSVSVHTFWAPLRSVFSLTIWGPLRSVSSPTIWGSPEIGFFAYYIRAPSDQFLRLLYEGPIRSVSLHTI